VTLEGHLNRLQSKALEKQASKIIKEAQRKERF
jgi:hypothetical protein